MGRAKGNKTGTTDVSAVKSKRSRKPTEQGKVPKAKATTTRKSSRKTTKTTEEAKKKVETFWTTDLTWKLYTAIIENEDIKRGLFPPPGSNASTKDGGGKAKIEFQAMLAGEVFGGENCEHKAAFEAAKTKAEKEAWVTKIKNKLASMAKATRKHCTALGQTGAGIRSADEVDRSQKNEFVNKFESILNEFPLFFEWRDLIGERPNVNPVGVGNMDSELDLAVLGDTDGASSAEEDDEDVDGDDGGNGIGEGEEDVDELDASDDGAVMNSDDEMAPARTGSEDQLDEPSKSMGTLSITVTNGRGRNGKSTLVTVTSGSAEPKIA
ncbi:hypothetical protein SCHPADRAFT_944633 [Schizopora paradoxa]|uniref:No apical meristem-associated C-terminal domain-containing protein n=1 Tax=Schizopora paradoxa TaxID=27342 RepID=A0A0H2RTS7_9AGAM|nr:hypothetical protein SCHPADRAFT_944633 [Schizopora paradoxa]